MEVEVGSSPHCSAAPIPAAASGDRQVGIVVGVGLFVELDVVVAVKEIRQLPRGHVCHARHPKATVDKPVDPDVQFTNLRGRMLL